MEYVLNSGFENQEDDRLHFVYKDLLYPSEKHQGKMCHLKNVSITLQCLPEPAKNISVKQSIYDKSSIRDCIFENLVIDGEDVKDINDTGSFLCMLHIVTCHTPIHIYALKIGKYIHKEASERAILDNMFAGACALAEAVYW